MLNEHGCFNFQPDRDAIDAKKEKVLKYLQLSKQLGKVDS